MNPCPEIEELVEEVPQQEEIPVVVTDYRVIETSIFDYKGVRIALIALFFIVAAIVLSKITWMTPEPQVEATTEFQKVALPKAATPPPPPPAVGVTVPMPTVIVKQDAAVSIQAPPPHFDALHIDMAKMAQDAMAHMTSPSTGNGPTTSQSQGIPGTITNVTTTGEMESLLHTDDRDGAVVGSYTVYASRTEQFPIIDAIRHKEIPSIGWDIRHKGYNNPGIKYGDEIPLLTSYPSYAFNTGRDDVDSIDGAMSALLDAKSTSFKTFVLVDDFTTPFSGSGAFTHDLIQKSCDTLLWELRHKGARLCIISFANAPYPPLMDYVRQTGGVCLYPRGIPPAAVAAALNQAVTK